MLLPALGLAIVCGVVLGACSSSGQATATTSGIESACSLVAAALSDGPDPTADPVGYAESQVRPLRQIKTPDSNLQAAIVRLASAYETFFTTKGSRSAEAALHKAGDAINVLCPGAAA